jgi:serine/threonine-protein kinase
MALAPGSQVGSYRILAIVGAGGMGQVYRALDTRLSREVALKVLPDAFQHDHERLARFEREAHVLASLNHPNIAHIYGVEESPADADQGTVRAIVMELVSGEDLSARIARGPIPVADALLLAAQVAHALEAAHESGVIHRDLKPGNIKVRDDGTAKVLDFGLAKALDPFDSTTSSPQSVVPTITSPAVMTGLGTILGTPAYMAPEQARGKPVDRRADVWAFGVILVEMLTGRPAFPGDEVTDVLAKIIEREPDLSALPASTPPTARQLIARCLIKDPKQRLRDIGEARIALDESVRELERGPSAISAGRKESVGSRRAFRLLPWVFAAVAGALAVWMSVRARPVASLSNSVVRTQVGLPAGVEFYTALGRTHSISADGRTLCLVGVNGGIREVYTRRLDQFEATPVPGTSPALSCFFSPDGRSLGVIDATSVLKRVSLVDGVVETVLTGISATASATWMSDNRIIFERDRGLWAVPAVAGGAPVPLVKPASSEELLAQPVAVPDRPAVIFTSQRGRPAKEVKVEVLSLRDGTRRILAERANFGLPVSTGHLLFVRGDTLMIQPFDLDRLVVTGTAAVALKDVNLNSIAEPSALTISKNGTLLYAAPGGIRRSLVWVTRDGVEQPLLDAGLALNNPRLTRDDKEVVVEDGAGGIYIRDFARRTFTRMTTWGAYPVLTPDRRRMVFRSIGGLFLQNLDGTGQPEPVGGTSVEDFPSGVSADGNEVLFTRINADGAGATDTYAAALNGRSAVRPVLAGPSWEGGAQISPDGGWILYASDETGRHEIYLRNYPALNRKVSVSSGGGLHPLWNPNGREIYFRNGNKMMAVSVTTAPDLKLSEPHVLFDAHYAYAGNVAVPNYAVAADGRFVMVKDDPQANRIDLVVNWIDEILRPPVR